MNEGKKVKGKQEEKYESDEKQWIGKGRQGWMREERMEVRKGKRQKERKHERKENKWRKEEINVPRKYLRNRVGKKKGRLKSMNLKQTIREQLKEWAKEEEN